MTQERLERNYDIQPQQRFVVIKDPVYPPTIEQMRKMLEGAGAYLSVSGWWIKGNEKALDLNEAFRRMEL